MVKNHTKSMTLGIGDGANDVGMLQEADVGIGVKGREGSQAAQASDFAIPRFQMLIPLLAIQGHWAMNRLSHVAIFMLYKNFAMICVYIWSSIETLGSPTAFYDEFLISFFNLFFTLLPPFAYGFFERDVTKYDLLRYPQLYHSVRNPMKVPMNLLFFLIGLYQGVVVFFIVRYTCPRDPLESNGNLCYFCIVCVIALQLLLWAYDWNWLMVVACVLTIVLLFAVTIVYAYIMTPSLIGVVEQTLGSLRGWCVILLTAAIGVFPPFAYVFFMDMINPGLGRLVREREGMTREGTLDFVELMKGNPAFRSSDPGEGSVEDLDSTTVPLDPIEGSGSG
jgi:magnesium-transporting ATPase (P-type)